MFDCNINPAVFNYWVAKDLIPKLPNNSIVVRDNLALPKSPHPKDYDRELKDYYRASRPYVREYVTLEYLPMYSPELNPLELKWCQAKSTIKQYYGDLDTLFAKYMS